MSHGGQLEFCHCEAYSPWQSRIQLLDEIASYLSASEFAN